MNLKKYFYYFTKMQSEKSHREYYKKFYADDINTFNNYVDKKKKSVIKKEMKILFSFWNVFPFQYYRYRMYRKDCTYSLSEMKKYVPDFFAYYILYPQSFKDRNMLLEDKRLFSVICNGYNVPHPRVFFTTCKGIFYDKCNDVHLIDSVVKQINDLSIDKLFIKPTYGVGGKGIFAFHRKDNCFVSHKNNIQLNKDFLNGISNSDYIIQEGLFQHKILNEIYPHSINTFRIFTQCIDEKEISTLFAILRIGQGSMEIDNASSGGMYVKINLETGILDKKALSITGKEYLKHPDSNFVFDGFPIPFWPEIKLLAEKTALKFKEVKYLGWDIALTENGPVIIEANNAPDISLLQDCYSGIKDVLNIDKPQSYWYSSKFNLKDG